MQQLIISTGHMEKFDIKNGGYTAHSSRLRIAEVYERGAVSHKCKIPTSGDTFVEWYKAYTA